MATIERAIGEGLATRLGADPDTDLYPWVLAAAAVGVVRACMAFWAGSGGSVQLGRLVEQAFQALAEGLPERGALHRITEPQLTAPQLTEPRITGNVTDRKESH